MLRWWLDRGVDGFRMDVLNLLSKNPALPDGEVPEGERYGNGLPFFVSGPRIHEFVHEMHREVFAGRAEPLLVVGETPGATLEEAKLFTDPARAEVDMVFQFEHVQLDRGTSWFDLQPLKLSALKASLGRWQDGLAETGWNSLYWNNHDQPRAVSRFGDDGGYRVRSAKLLATVLHLHRGTPYIFQGEELGMTNPPLATIDDFRDFWSLEHYAEQRDAGAAEDDTLAALRAAGRDNARTPMQWDDSEHAGFTTETPWMAVNPNYTEINARDQQADEHSVLQHYRHLIALRQDEPAVVHGDFHMLLADHEQVYAFTRHHHDTELLVLANFSSTPITVEVPNVAHWKQGELLLSNLPTAEAIGETLTLQPWEARVHRRA
jgi:oligo-1,6-glucosidase